MHKQKSTFAQVVMLINDVSSSIFITLFAHKYHAHQYHHKLLYHWSRISFIIGCDAIIVYIIYDAIHYTQCHHNLHNVVIIYIAWYTTIIVWYGVLQNLKCV